MAQGRQAANYQKYGFSIKFLKLDAYLIVVPKQTYIPRHKDPAPKNYKHNRCNLTIWGSGRLCFFNEVERTYATTKRFVKFQPSEVLHSFYAETKCVILSIGWLK